MLLHEALGLGEEVVRHFVILPAGRMPALHESDAGDAVDEGVLVAVVPAHRHPLRVRLGRRLAGEVLLVIHLDRVVRIEVLDQSVLDIDGRDTVHRRRDQMGKVETDRIGGRRDRPVPVREPVPHPEVPFADGAGRISGRLEHLRQGGESGIDHQGRIARQDLHSAPEGIHAREEGVAAGRGGRAGRIGVVEHKPGGGERVQVRRRDGPRPIAPDIPYPQVVGHDQEDIRPDGGLDPGRDVVGRTSGRRQRQRDQGPDGGLGIHFTTFSRASSIIL